jgi:hypothetical protein
LALAEAVTSLLPLENLLLRRQQLGLPPVQALALLVPVVLLVLAAGEQLVALAEAAVEWLLPVALAAEAAEAAVE